MKKPLVFATLIILSMLASASVEAGWRRHPVRTRVWVGHRIVVHRPVVVAPIVIQGRPHGCIDFDVKPEETKVYVGEELRGTVDDFDGVPGKLNLLPGPHRIRLVTPDGDTWEERIRVVAGHEINVNLELDK